MAIRLDFDGRRRFLRHFGADRVELYTEPYAAAYGTAAEARAFRDCQEAAEAAQAQGLGLNAGHDLNLDNLPMLVRGLPNLLEVSIGHAITADALRMGYAAAVAEYLKALAPEAARSLRAAAVAEYLKALAPEAARSDRATVAALEHRA